MITAFLIKYGEIGIKGNNRYIFEDALVRQIRHALYGIDGGFKVHKESGRIYATATEAFDSDEVIEALKKVFGIVWICPVEEIDDNGFDDLSEHCIRFLKESYPEENFSFKVQARRGRKNYPMDSMEINAQLGGRILDAMPQTRVDVHNPEVLLRVEIRGKIYMYCKEIPGPGGMPVGTAGKAMLLLSGGIDSPVAGYMISKRGVQIEATYFHAPPYTSERAKQKVVDLADEVSAYAGPIRLHIVNFTDIQMAIYQKCPHDELTIIMRRFMMQIAEEIARKNDCLGLITGESIGQVASQTMPSLLCTNAVCTLPVYRPLIGMDKQEIINISEKIGTYDTSIEPYEDCCTIFVAKHPVTKPLLHVIERDEKKLDGIEELVKKAVDTEEIISCGKKIPEVY
ncbi:MAG: tRNA 4-thiouridine(8) synthase ThiI [Lachnospira sp.]|nr:tRNA 4-thiouridine(8) synthase ThiI [Lachnospira sp.]